MAHLADRHGYILCRQHLESAMPSQRSKGGKSARSRGAPTPLPTKSGGSAGKGMLCGCPKQQIYFAGVAFCVVYTLAFLSVVRHHQHILAYLHKKEDQIMHKWGEQLHHSLLRAR